MDEILQDVKKLSVDELRSRLQELGEKVGPIVPTTKLLFQKKLARKLHELSQSSASETSQNDADEVDNVKVEERPPTPPCQVPVAAKNGVVAVVDPHASIFYGVSLPHGTENSEGSFS